MYAKVLTTVASFENWFGNAFKTKDGVIVKKYVQHPRKNKIA